MADAATRRRFAGDLLNLTLASPTINRHQKSGNDGAEWLPDLNQCWFADRVVRVRQEYRLTIDQRESDALEDPAGVVGWRLRELARARGATDAALERVHVAHTAGLPLYGPPDNGLYNVRPEPMRGWAHFKAPWWGPA